jgi:hypothetical protein
MFLVPCLQACGSPAQSGTKTRASDTPAPISKPEISGIAPLFIVKHVPAALAFYRDLLGFDVTFQGPEPGDVFFGIVQRGAAMIMFD